MNVASVSDIGSVSREECDVLETELASSRTLCSSLEDSCVRLREEVSSLKELQQSSERSLEDAVCTFSLLQSICMIFPSLQCQLYRSIFFFCLSVFSFFCSCFYFYFYFFLLMLHFISLLFLSRFLKILLECFSVSPYFATIFTVTTCSRFRAGNS